MKNFSANKYVASKTSRIVIGSFLILLCTICLSITILGLSYKYVDSASSATVTQTYYCILKVNGKNVVLTCTDTQEEGYSTNGQVWNGLWSKLLSTGTFKESHNQGYHEYKITENFDTFKSFFSDAASFADIGYVHLFTNMSYEDEWSMSWFYATSKDEALKNNRYVYELKIVAVRISTYNQLLWFKENYKSKSITKAYLEKDIDLGGVAWTPIGSNNKNSFSGTFDGQKHTLKNFTIAKNNNDYYSGTGFFGYIQGDATISNLNLVNVKLELSNTANNSRGFGIGILVGHHGFWDDDTYYHDSVYSTLSINNCAITNCSISIPKGLNTAISGNVYWTGGMGIGGLVGSSKSNVRISNCSVQCDITIGGALGSTYESNKLWGIGGIMGARLKGISNVPNGNINISNCLYSGKISTASRKAEFGVAGILGIANCLASSSVSLKAFLNNNFVDMYYSYTVLGSAHPICTGNRVSPYGMVQTRDFNYTNSYTNNGVSPENRPFQYVQMTNNYFGFKSNSKPSDISSMFMMFYSTSSKNFEDYTTAKYYTKYNDSLVAEVPTYKEFD